MTDNPIELIFSGLPAQADKFLMGISTVALVRLAGRTILFDTGPYAYRPILQGRMKRLGIDPAAIDTVILSHVHWDMAANADLFPNADIVIHHRELAYAQAKPAHDALTPAYVADVLGRLKLKTIAGEVEIAPGAKIVELPGHTPGSIGLLVGDQLLAGDAVHCVGDAVSGLFREGSMDIPSAQASLQKALGLATIIYPGHDRPFRLGSRHEYLSDYALRLRFFTDPLGQDEELRIGGFVAKSFASWPND